MHKPMRSEESLNSIIQKYLDRNGINHPDRPWTIKRSTLGGFGVFSSRKIQESELIFLDTAIITGPRFLPKLTPICVSCYKTKPDLIRCPDCSIPICPEGCDHSIICSLLRRLFQDSPSSGDLLLRCLTPLLALLIPEVDREVIRNLAYHKGAQHGQEIEELTKTLGLKVSEEEREFLVRVCSVLDANAFEVVAGGDEENQTSLRGLFPLAGLANHRCYPNTFHVFDERRRMVVRASVPIGEGEEIFHSYSRLIWDTGTRSYHLKKTKHFVCKCDRCLDPTEFGTYLSAMSCKKCRGNVLPLEPTKRLAWRCQDCQASVNAKDIGDSLSLIGSVLKHLDDVDFKILRSFLDNKVSKMVPETNQVVVELKCKIVWCLGYKPGYEFNNLPLELLDLKIRYCKDILDVLEKLRVGLCKLKGLLLFEIYQCLEQCKTRENNNNNLEDSTKYLMQSSQILRRDVSAPDIIKKLDR